MGRAECMEELAIVAVEKGKLLGATWLDGRNHPDLVETAVSVLQRAPAVAPARAGRRCRLTPGPERRPSCAPQSKAPAEPLEERGADAGKTSAHRVPDPRVGQHVAPGVTRGEP